MEGFDFNRINKAVCLTVNEVHKYVSRYHSQAIPEWFNLPFRSIDFNQSPYFNDLAALMHFNDIECEVLPVNYVIDPSEKYIDIDRDLSFIKITCNTVDEARRRAYVIANLTYDVHSGIFVKLSTQSMLQDPYIL